MENNKQKNDKRKLDFSPTPYQILLVKTAQYRYDPQKVKKEFIKTFGTTNIRISGGMSLDEYVNEWCRVLGSRKELDEQLSRLSHMLEDHLYEIYTEGQRNVWFHKPKNVRNGLDNKSRFNSILRVLEKFGLKV